MQIKLRLHNCLGVGKRSSDGNAWKEAQFVMTPLIAEKPLQLLEINSIIPP